MQSVTGKQGYKAKQRPRKGNYLYYTTALQHLNGCSNMTPRLVEIFKLNHNV